MTVTIVCTPTWSFLSLFHTGVYELSSCLLLMSVLLIYISVAFELLHLTGTTCLLSQAFCFSVPAPHYLSAFSVSSPFLPSLLLHSVLGIKPRVSYMSSKCLTTKPFQPSFCFVFLKQGLTKFPRLTLNSHCSPNGS